MKIGDKIQALRKSKGLSQETLAEKLNISRQAISKWESGITVPSIENLIELGKIFNVSVGELLQVPEKEGENITPEVIKTFSKEYEERRLAQDKKFKKIILMVATIALVLLVFLIVLVVMFSIFSSRMDQKIRNVENEVTNIYDNVSSEIRNISEDVQAQLDEKDRIVEDYTCKATEVDVLNEIITLHITTVPKTFKPHMTASFKVVFPDGSSVVEEGTLQNDGIFFCDIKLPLGDDEIKIYVSYTQNGETKTQLMGSKQNLKEQYTLAHMNSQFFGDFKDYLGGDAVRMNGEVLVVVPLSIDYEEGLETCWPIKVELEIYTGGKLVERLRLEEIDNFKDPFNGEIYEAEASRSALFYDQLNKKMSLKNREIQSFIVVTDNFGKEYREEMWELSSER